MPIWTGALSSSWNTAGNWAIDGSGNTGIPTSGTDAIFSSASSVQCNVDTATAACRNLNFAGGTGYAGTINMTNNITVGAGNTANQNQAVTLSAAVGFTVSGSGGIIVRANGTTTLTSNGVVWPNNLSLSTITVTTVSTILLIDNWTVGGRLTVGDTVRKVTFNGAFNINVRGGLSMNTGTAGGNGCFPTAGSISTITFSGSGSQTWTQSSFTSIGINIVINTTGTVTITDGCSYGGDAIVSGSTFSYVTGTVITQGTFRLLVYQNNAGNYTVNLNGSSSTTATATSSTGVNFNILTIYTITLNNANNITLSSPICVVDDFNIISSSSKFAARITGSTIYVNKSFTVNAYLASNSTSTIRLQGTGTWSESAVLAQNVTGFGLGGTTVVINTAGTITLGSIVGLNSTTLIYTAGAFVVTGYGFRAQGATLTGLGSGGITIPTLVHSTNGAIGTPIAAITINDTVPLLIGTLTITDFSVTNAHRYAGTAGWTCTNFSYQHTASVTNADFGLIATAGIVYTVTGSFIFRAYTSTGSEMIKQGGTATRAVFTLKFGASQDVFGMGATEIDSSAEQTVWTRKGVLFNTLNWNLWTFPKTRFSTFIS